MHLSKSRLIAGLQCHKQLWWRVHEPHTPELVAPPERQAVFDQGRRVGERAREEFPGGVLVDARHRDFTGRLEQTRAALEAGAPAIFEASFLEDDVFVAVDVLERTPQGWALVEVKSSTKMKPQYLPDVAVQTRVVRRAGLNIERVEVMHLNRECRFPNLRTLFARDDVTEDVETLLPELSGTVAAQLRMLNEPCPEVPVGRHCETPYPCPFLERCWPAVPEHHVSTLYHIGRKAADLEARAYSTIHQLPHDLDLPRIADRQRRAVQGDRLIVESSLREALVALRRPYAVLDFETVQLAIPIWNGCRPYDQVPAQFSCHVVSGPGAIAHHAWLVDGPGDPRPELAARVVDACRHAQVVVAYSAPFEAGVLSDLADSVPEYAASLADIKARLIDALPLVRDYVYHPAFGGSFSLKAVLPALVSGMTYDTLDIAGGRTATLELQRLMFEGDTLSADEREQARNALLRYCALDTLGVVRLLERLEALVDAERVSAYTHPTYKKDGLPRIIENYMKRSVGVRTTAVVKAFINRWFAGVKC